MARAITLYLLNACMMKLHLLVAMAVPEQAPYPASAASLSRSLSWTTQRSSNPFASFTRQ